jgi:hypothetical protein
LPGALTKRNGNDKKNKENVNPIIARQTASTYERA